mmetsp:Transcript_78145/g.253601  ORF Transcript_78145/g.253601 Transcript_78145/m.253601 type:complete len:643 (+) Transcript_78145:103-2031(+)
MAQESGGEWGVEIWSNVDDGHPPKLRVPGAGPMAASKDLRVEPAPLKASPSRPCPCRLGRDAQTSGEDRSRSDEDKEDLRVEPAPLKASPSRPRTRRLGRDAQTSGEDRSRSDEDKEDNREEIKLKDGGMDGMLALALGLRSIEDALKRGFQGVEGKLDELTWDLNQRRSFGPVSPASQQVVGPLAKLQGHLVLRGGSKLSKGKPDAAREKLSKEYGEMWKNLQEQQSRRVSRASITLTEGCQISKPSKAERFFDALSGAVNHRYFDYCIMCFVALNAMLIGAEVQYQTQNNGTHTVFKVFEVICGTIFTAELLTRLFALGLRAVRRSKPIRNWMLFDAVLVVLSWLDLCIYFLASKDMPGMTSSMSRLLRVFRIIKVFRFFRMFEFLGELRVMATMIVNSTSSLFWLFVLLLMLFYTIAVVLTQAATDWLKDQKTRGHDSPIERYYGTLWESMYTLFKSMSGGVSWGEVAGPLKEMSMLYFSIFLVFIFFTIFSVLNIVTGVFVDSAIQMSKRDRTVLIRQQKASNQANLLHLLSLLQEIDEDGNGQITAGEIEGALCRPEVKDFLILLGLDTEDLLELTATLEQDGDGVIDIVEFVEGVNKLKGDVKKSDLHMLIRQNCKVLNAIQEFIDLMAQCTSPAG